MTALRIYTNLIAVFAFGMAGLAVWFLIDEVETQHLRRSSIEKIDFPKTVPKFASADRLDALATRALETKPWRLDLSKSATELSIRKNSRRTSNWNRLAYIDIATHSMLTAEGISALEESFFRAPYGKIADMKWRLELSNAYWEQLPDELRTQSLAQITALANHWDGKPWLREFRKTCRPEIKARIDQILGLSS